MSKVFPNKAIVLYIFASVFVLGCFFVNPVYVDAATVDELKQNIEKQRSEIAEIEAQIEKFQNQIFETQEEANTIKRQISILTANANKLSLDIKLTNQKIAASNLAIQDLSMGIREKEDSVENIKSSLSRTLRIISEADNTSMTEIFLNYPTFSEFFVRKFRINSFEEEAISHLEHLKQVKKELDQKKREKSEEKANYESLNSKLYDQKQIVDINKNTQNKFLSETKNEEAEYQAMLDRNLALKNEFEKELRDFESQLRIIIDPNSLPPSGSGVLSWPLESVYLTQRFGKTVAAKRLYTSGSHNGVDFRASVGTPVFAAASGVVIGTGDTDLTCKGASFGKWILIDYENGLASTYGHLSLIKVSNGQRVSRGEVVGYSGNTGYSTGPHLHMTVYARQGVAVKTRPSGACGGKVYTLPLAPIEAYLDPLEYL